MATGAIIESVDNSSAETRDDAIPKSEPIAQTEPIAISVSEPYGDCTKQRHSMLNKDVGHKCKDSSMKMKCTKYMCLEEININIKRFQDCIEARRTMNNECYKGGDLRHNVEVTNALKGLGKCLDFQAEKVKVGCKNII